MKKVVLCLIIYILIVSTACSEEAVYETGRDLWLEWDKNNNYPDYVCGIITSDEKGLGVYDVGVIDSEHIETVLNLVKDKNTVNVFVQKYSHAYLSEIEKDINDKYSDIIAATIVNTRFNQLSVIVKGEQSDSEKQKVEAEIEKEYGKAVRIEPYEPMEETSSVDSNNNPSNWRKKERNKTILAVSVTAVTLVLIILFFKKVKKDNTEKT